MPNNYIPMQAASPYINVTDDQKIKSVNHQISIFDIMSIFSFVASIVGCFCIALIFEPAAIITALIGFKKGKRFKPLCASAIIISVISFIIQLFTLLYRAGIISKWLMNGIFY